jgi:hypothetical protein
MRKRERERTSRHAAVCRRRRATESSEPYVIAALCAAMVGTVFLFSRQRGRPAEIIMRAQCFHRDDCTQNADDLQ